MLAEPLLTAVTTPEVLTVATEELELDHVTPSTLALFTVAVALVVLPGFRDVLARETETVIAGTVMVTVA